MGSKLKSSSKLINDKGENLSVKEINIIKEKLKLELFSSEKVKSFKSSKRLSLAW